MQMNQIRVCMVVFSLVICMQVVRMWFSMQVSSPSGGLSSYNKSIHLPVLVGVALTTLDESFHEAVCGKEKERRWLLTGLWRAECYWTMVRFRMLGGVPACVAVGTTIPLMSTGLETLQQRPLPLRLGSDLIPACWTLERPHPPTIPHAHTPH